MFLTHKTQESLVDRGYSRRQIGRIAKGAAAAIPFFNEFAQAQQAQQLATSGSLQVMGKSLMAGH